MEYDALNRPVYTHNVLANNNTLSKYVQTFDAAGRVEKCLLRNDDAIYYDYDNTGRATGEVWKSSGGSTIYAFAWDYDAVGNRIYEYKQTSPAVETYYTYNEINRPLHKHVLPADAYTYYEYDGRNNIARVVEPSQYSYFEYDAANRLEKTIYYDPSAGSYQCEYFSYDALGRLAHHSPREYHHIYFAYDANGMMLSKNLGGEHMPRLNGHSSVLSMYDWYPYYPVYGSDGEFCAVIRQGYFYPSDIARFNFNSRGALINYDFPFSIEQATSMRPNSLQMPFGQVGYDGTATLNDGEKAQADLPKLPQSPKQPRLHPKMPKLPEKMKYIKRVDVDDCTTKCHAHCDEKYPHWWQAAQFYACYSYCDTTCNREMDWVDRVFSLCDVAKIVSENPVGNCFCATMQVLDNVIPNNKVYGAFDALCSGVSTYVTACDAVSKKTTWSTLKAEAMAILLFPDVALDLIPTDKEPIFETAVAVAQNMITSRGNPIGPQIKCLEDINKGIDYVLHAGATLYYDFASEFFRAVIDKSCPIREGLPPMVGPIL